MWDEGTEKRRVPWKAVVFRKGDIRRREKADPNASHKKGQKDRYWSEYKPDDSGSWKEWNFFQRAKEVIKSALKGIHSFRRHSRRVTLLICIVTELAKNGFGGQVLELDTKIPQSGGQIHFFSLLSTPPLHSRAFQPGWSMHFFLNKTLINPDFSPFGIPPHYVFFKSQRKFHLPLVPWLNIAHFSKYPNYHISENLR